MSGLINAAGETSAFDPIADRTLLPGPTLSEAGIYVRPSANALT